MLTGHFGTGPSPRIRYAFTGRAGGTSEGPFASRNLGRHVGDDPATVEANRAQTAADLGLPVESLVFMHQTHTDVVQTVTPSGSRDFGDCDGLVTATPGLALAVMVADCVPVVMAEPSAGVVAAVHAGRRGVQNGIVGRALERMTDLGAASERVQVRMGPAVCGSCYEVPKEMSDDVLRVAPESEAQTPAGTQGLDLRRGLIGVFRDLGVTDVELVGPCTRESPDFFSYRRAAGEPTGRNAGFVWLAAENA